RNRRTQSSFLEARTRVPGEEDRRSFRGLLAAESRSLGAAAASGYVWAAEADSAGQRVAAQCAGEGGFAGFPRKQTKPVRTSGQRGFGYFLRGYGRSAGASARPVVLPEDGADHEHGRARAGVYGYRATLQPGQDHNPTGGYPPSCARRVED